MRRDFLSYWRYKANKVRIIDIFCKIEYNKSEKRVYS